MWLTLLLSMVLQTATPAPPVIVVFETTAGNFEVAVDVAHAPDLPGFFGPIIPGERRPRGVFLNSGSGSLSAL